MTEKQHGGCAVSCILAVAAALLAGRLTLCCALLLHEWAHLFASVACHREAALITPANITGERLRPENYYVAPGVLKRR